MNPRKKAMRTKNFVLVDGFTGDRHEGATKEVLQFLDCMVIGEPRTRPVARRAQRAIVRGEYGVAQAELALIGVVFYARGQSTENRRSHALKGRYQATRPPRPRRWWHL